MENINDSQEQCSQVDDDKDVVVNDSLEYSVNINSSTVQQPKISQEDESMKISKNAINNPTVNYDNYIDNWIGQNSKLQNLEDKQILSMQPQNQFFPANENKPINYDFKVLKSKLTKFAKKPDWIPSNIALMKVRIHAQYPQRGYGFFQCSHSQVQIMFHLCDLKNLTQTIPFMQISQIEFQILSYQENNNRYKLFMIDKSFFQCIKRGLTSLISDAVDIAPYIQFLNNHKSKGTVDI